MLLGTDIPNQVFWNEIPTPMFRKIIPKLLHWNEIPKRVLWNGLPTAYGRSCPLSIILRSGEVLFCLYQPVPSDTSISMYHVLCLDSSVFMYFYFSSYSEYNYTLS